MSIIKPQSTSHWYAADGSPMYEVPKAKGGGTRKTTIRDARKHGWVPSVTSILKIVDKPFLGAWLTNQAIEACIKVSQEMQNPLTEDDLPRIKELSEKISTEARDKGTAYHRSVEAIMFAYADGVTGDSFDLPWATYEALIDLFHRYNLKPKSLEQPFACKYGYGGKVDFVGYGAIRPDDNTRRMVVCDWKTQATKEGKPFRVYPEVSCQLSAYAAGIGKATADLGVVYISTTEPERVELRYLPDNDDYFIAFLDAFRVWRGFLGKNYEPTVVK